MTVASNVAIKVPLIRTTVYSFKHSSVETWQGNRLKNPSSQTNDDGARHQVSVCATSLWNEDIRAQFQVGEYGRR